MRKLTREEKPRLQIYTRPTTYMVQFTSSCGRRWRGIGATHYLAYASLEALLREYRINMQMQVNQRTFLNEGLKNGPDIGLGPSDYHIATSNLPWWRRLFRI